MSPRDVEISIVNHQNRELVRSCLRSLPPACDNIDWHATVIDNASGDGSLEMLAAEFGHVGVIANRVALGFGANHNQVLRHLIEDGSARYALVLNDDTELRPGAVTRLVELMDRDPGIGAAIPAVIDGQGRPAPGRLSYPTARNALRCDRTDVTEPPDADGGWLQGCCILLRVDALARVGPFDERFFLFYEDTDLSRRMVDAGWSLAVCPTATVVHHGHATVFKPGIIELVPRLGRRSRHLYLCKYEGRRRAALITRAGRAILLARGLRVAAQGALARDPAAQARARDLLALARYDPRKPSAQEAEARAARETSRSDRARL